ncbi:DUF4198 domain-containing protein [Hirschia maritima]|uniref:DUF4198 domain-containing protein n=1 Tax=Hirschia maritima TaxID=1121961 RepID=UPI00035F9997|nr:DUF4198 domain-containing protein [Hirschia maritima]
MKFGLRPLLLAAVLGAVAVPSAQAHRMWILPSTFTLSGDEQTITVDGAISNDLFFPNHVAMNLENITISAPDGTTSKPQNGWEGEIRSTFDLKLDEQGTYKIAEEGGFYFARWEEEGEEKRTRGNWERLEKLGLLEKPDVKLMYAGRRAETFVTLGAPTQHVFKPTGEGVEMVPVTHPNDLYQGEEASFKFLIDGAPVIDQAITIVKGNDRYRDIVGEFKVKTDAEGIVSFTPEEPGRYWLQTRAQKPGEAQGRKMMLMSTYSATFEVLTP